jgi:hypothetical protein
MQKTVYTLLALLLFSPAFSQINKGAILIGADVVYNKSTIKSQGDPNAEQKYFQLSPSLSTAFRTNTIIGVDLTYSGSDYENEGVDYMMEAKDLGAGLFIRKYKPIVNAFHVFLQGRLGYINIDRENGDFSDPAQRSTTEGSNINLGATPGISYRAGKILLELSLNNILKILQNMNPSTYHQAVSLRLRSV